LLMAWWPWLRCKQTYWTPIQWSSICLALFVSLWIVKPPASRRSEARKSQKRIARQSINPRASAYVIKDKEEESEPSTRDSVSQPANPNGLKQASSKSVARDRCCWCCFRDKRGPFSHLPPNILIDGNQDSSSVNRNSTEGKTNSEIPVSSSITNTPERLSPTKSPREAFNEALGSNLELQRQGSIETPVEHSNDSIIEEKDLMEGNRNVIFFDKTGLNCLKPKNPDDGELDVERASLNQNSNGRLKTDSPPSPLPGKQTHQYTPIPPLEDGLGDENDVIITGNPKGKVLRASIRLDGTLILDRPNSEK